MAGDGGASLRRAGERAAGRLLVVLTLVSVGAMVGLTNRADERFHPYNFGPETLREPWRVVTDPVRIAVANADTYGNFRPLGRVVEHASYLVDEVLAVTLRLPLHVVLGITRLAAAVGLGLVLLALVRRLAGGARSWLVTAVACVFPTLLVAYGNGSSIVVFSAMYLATTAVVLACPLGLTAPTLYDVSRALPRRRLLLAAAAGAGVALFNELAYVAAPVAIVTVAALLVARRVPLRAARTVPAVRLLAAAAGGFVLLAVPVRLYLAVACAEPGTCYEPSDPSLGGLGPRLVVARLLAGLPLQAARSGDLVGGLGTMLLVAVLVAPVLAALLVRAARRPGPAGDHAPDAVLAPAAARLVVAAVGGALVVSGAALSSLSGSLQGADVGQGWREAPVAFAGWALVLGAAASVLLDRLRGATAAVLLVAGAALGVGAAVVVTGFQHDRDAADPRLRQTELVGLEFASWDESETGDARRCELVELFVALHPERDDQLRRFTNAVDRAARIRHGVPFCDAEGAS